jgi:hypothetical protein
MQVKLFSALLESTLERKVNKFISNTNIIVNDIQFQVSFGQLCVMITYENKNQ